MATEGPQVGSFHKNKQAAILWGASVLGNCAGREKERVEVLPNSNTKVESF
jgi:hypothetical protein